MCRIGLNCDTVQVIFKEISPFVDCNHQSNGIETDVCKIIAAAAIDWHSHEQINPWL